MNNPQTPKRKLKGRCRICQTSIHSNRTFCSDCWGGPYLGASKEEALTQDTQRYRRIRSQARIIAKRLGLLDQCVVCGYTAHVEICHKKPIQAYPPDAHMSEINDLSNLVGLCPNHHWELDHGLIMLQEG